MLPFHSRYCEMLLNLHAQLLRNIVLYVDNIQDITSLSRTCNFLHTLCNEEHIWSFRFKNRFGKASNSIVGWKFAYKLLHKYNEVICQSNLKFTIPASLFLDGILL